MITREEFDALVTQVQRLTDFVASMVAATQAATAGTLAAHEENGRRFRALENSVQLIAAGLAASRRS